MDGVFLGVDVVTLVLYFFVLLFAIGIVWRVEHELDWSYKFFVIATLALMLSEVLDLYFVGQDSLFVLIAKSLRLGGAIAFLLSILLMRDIVRKLDHEKQ